MHAAARGSLGEAARQLGPGPIGAVAVVVVQALRDGLALSRGEIDAATFAGRTVTSAAVSGGGVVGGAVGQALIPVPVVGALIGSLVGSLLAGGGVAAVTVGAEAAWTQLRDESALVAHVLGDLDALAHVQSERLEATLAEAAEAARQLRGHGFDVARDLRLAEIDIDVLCRQDAAHRSTLARWEVRAASWQDDLE